MISTASKSLPLKDWLSDEHANMFFPVAAQPMSHAEEEHLLLQTGCPALVVDALLRFADRYRTSMTADAVQKNRKLGTRALMRIARRAAQFPSIEPDLHTLLSRAVLAEFLPATEAMNLLNICEETGITKRTPAVSSFPALAVRRPVRRRSRGSRTMLIVCTCLRICYATLRSSTLRLRFATEAFGSQRRVGRTAGVTVRPSSHSSTEPRTRKGCHIFRIWTTSTTIAYRRA